MSTGTHWERRSGLPLATRRRPVNGATGRLHSSKLRTPAQRKFHAQQKVPVVVPPRTTSVPSSSLFSSLSGTRPRPSHTIHVFLFPLPLPFPFAFPFPFPFPFPPSSSSPPCQLLPTPYVAGVLSHSFEDVEDCTSLTLGAKQGSVIQLDRKVGSSSNHAIIALRYLHTTTLFISRQTTTSSDPFSNKHEHNSRTAAQVFACISSWRFRKWANLTSNSNTKPLSLAFWRQIPCSAS